MCFFSGVTARFIATKCNLCVRGINFEKSIISSPFVANNSFANYSIFIFQLSRGEAITTVINNYKKTAATTAGAANEIQVCCLHLQHTTFVHRRCFCFVVLFFETSRGKKKTKQNTMSIVHEKCRCKLTLVRQAVRHSRLSKRQYSKMENQSEIETNELFFFFKIIYTIYTGRLAGWLRAKSTTKREKAISVCAQNE